MSSGVLSFYDGKRKLGQKLKGNKSMFDGQLARLEAAKSKIKHRSPESKLGRISNYDEFMSKFGEEFRVDEPIITDIYMDPLRRMTGCGQCGIMNNDK
ncbi:unnamed protein product [Dovyalis caffra]|uniref:Uncharacterized protein n=1 Tax=Dovyalis caffra TaxID=77055 RepID=A0AAV1RNV9_9ROSI|nr:unnamed protein product [Dovyalis caffra]